MHEAGSRGRARGQETCRGGFRARPHIRSPKMAFSLLPLRHLRHLRQFGGAQALNSPFALAKVATLATVRGFSAGTVAAVASVASWFKEMLLACLTARVARGRSTGRVPHREPGL